MLSSIHPLGERARHNRWGVTVAGFIVGAVGAGAGVGGVLGWVGSALPTGDWRWVAALSVVVLAGAADLARIAPPGPHRQVNEDWIGAYRGWVYGFGFGSQLGVGAATYVVTWGVWATAVLAVLAGEAMAGAVIGAAFGIGRSLVPVAAGWIDRPSRLTTFNQRMAALATPVARGSGVALVAVAVTGLVVAV